MLHNRRALRAAIQGLFVVLVAAVISKAAGASASIMAVITGSLCFLGALRVAGAASGGIGSWRHSRGRRAHAADEAADRTREHEPTAA